MDLSWYETCIEPEVREAVFILRNHGFNTIGSDGEKKWISVIPNNMDDIYNIMDILYQKGFRNFQVKYCIFSEGYGLSECYIEVLLDVVK